MRRQRRSPSRPTRVSRVATRGLEGNSRQHAITDERCADTAARTRRARLQWNRPPPGRRHGGRRPGRRPRAAIHRPSHSPPPACRAQQTGGTARRENDGEVAEAGVAGDADGCGTTDANAGADNHPTASGRLPPATTRRTTTRPGPHTTALASVCGTGTPPASATPDSTSNNPTRATPAPGRQHAGTAGERHTHTRPPRIQGQLPPQHRHHQEQHHTVSRVRQVAGSEGDEHDQRRQQQPPA